MTYEKYSAHTLYHMKDWDDFDTIHKAIIKAARSGASEIQFEWKGKNDRLYLIREIQKHFPGVEVHSSDKLFIVEWSKACQDEQHV